MLFPIRHLRPLVLQLPQLNQFYYYYCHSIFFCIYKNLHGFFPSNNHCWYYNPNHYNRAGRIYNNNNNNNYYHSSFTAGVKMNFKHRVAEILSSHCQRQVREERECQRSDEDRKRRSPDAVVFSPTDVHIPPGYPQRSSTRGSILLAFFVVRPDSADDFAPFPVDTIMMVLQLSQPQLQLQQALGSKPITSMVPYPQYLYGATVPATTRTTLKLGDGKPPGKPQEDSKFPLVAVSATAAVLALVALAIAVVVCLKKSQASAYRVGTPPYIDTPVLQYDYDDSVKRVNAAKEVWGVDNPIVILDSKV
ncbi:Hypp101 [Branchiostoma lanceolatum]|uniref:Hypp101 protein n=1 Tax=Branchiostoma lanceolatum TaxID=7740 RepID=A0A8J9VJ73_BRALA|nr:Hypp101 [Branchiostoma lanceolatum]